MQKKERKLTAKDLKFYASLSRAEGSIYGACKHIEDIIEEFKEIEPFQRDVRDLISTLKIVEACSDQISGMIWRKEGLMDRGDMK